MNIGQRSIQVNEEGYLVNSDEWAPEVAEVLARNEGIELTDRHWEVLDFCRRDYRENGDAPGLRRITKVGGIPTKELYQLFPGGPGKLSAKLAGLKKPTSCV